MLKEKNNFFKIEQLIWKKYMARSKSSHRWLKEHFKDPFVQRAQQEGYRSRVAYKLQEIQQRDRIIRPGMRIAELGAAPGGWTQYLSDRKSTRLNSSHTMISYAVFCLKKKIK